MNTNTTNLRLATLSEEPIVDDQKDHESSQTSISNRTKAQTWRLKKWIKTLLLLNKKSHLNILLSVLACPLFPVPLLPNDSSLSQVSSSAQYIMQHFAAATGCRKLEGTMKNMYATGKVSMAMADELGSSSGSTAGVMQKGCFVIWQMLPNKWLIELVAGGHKIVAGSDGNVAWRHTPWLGSHTAKGGVRPLRRALQGLDPMAISTVFSLSQYVGEKRISGVDCFILKLSTDHTALISRSDNTAEMIKHVMFGYFSQRSGLLVYLEDSYLTRIQSPGSHPTYWETTMATTIQDYRTVEGVMIAHSGHSDVIITRFGDNLRMGPAITKMEETWAIDDISFNVHGLSMDCFIPPEDVHSNYSQENLGWKSTLQL